MGSTFVHPESPLVSSDCEQPPPSDNELLNCETLPIDLPDAQKMINTSDEEEEAEEEGKGDAASNSSISLLADEDEEDVTTKLERICKEFVGDDDDDDFDTVTAPAPSGISQFDATTAKLERIRKRMEAAGRSLIIAVDGPPGSGKTSYIRALEHEYCSSNLAQPRKRKADGAVLSQHSISFYTSDTRLMLTRLKRDDMATPYMLACYHEQRLTEDLNRYQDIKSLSLAYRDVFIREKASIYPDRHRTIIQEGSFHSISPSFMLEHKLHEICNHPDIVVLLHRNENVQDYNTDKIHRRPPWGPANVADYIKYLQQPDLGKPTPVYVVDNTYGHPPTLDVLLLNCETAAEAALVEERADEDDSSL